MTITRIEYTLIPQTLEGQAFADMYEARLKEQNAFNDRKEDTTIISIKATYHFEIEGEAEE